MKRFVLLAGLLFVLAACGTPAGPNTWRVKLLDAAGHTLDNPSALVVVLFTPEQPARRVLEDLRHGMRVEHFDLPALRQGHYELWLPGCRPLRVDERPTEALQFEIGYPIDVTWREDAPLPKGQRVQIRVAWRGPGDAPEALVRAMFHAAAPPPGKRSWAWTSFVKGSLIEAPGQPERIYVPWPGPYRIRWGIGHIRIQEAAGSFSAHGGGSRSPADATSIEVPGTGPAPTVMIPPR